MVTQYSVILPFSTVTFRSLTQTLRTFSSVLPAWLIPLLMRRQSFPAKTR